MQRGALLFLQAMYGFDPEGSGNVTFPFSRALEVEGTGVPGSPRSQWNEQNHVLDLSGVYGTDDCQGQCDEIPYFPKEKKKKRNENQKRLQKRHGDRVVLRTYQDGKLFTNTTFDMDEKMVPNQPLFRTSGDPRANKLPPLFALHHIFVDEHNRLCDELKVKHPEWDDDTLFQEARRWNVAFYQKISTREWLATLLGQPLPPYKGYNSSANSGLDNFFATVALRYGHSEINTVIPRRDESYNTIPEGDLVVRDIQWRPDLYGMAAEPGIEPIIRGLASTAQGLVGLGFVNDVRNMNTNHPTLLSLRPLTDLPAWNVQRGRDHGIPSYNDARTLR
eukprot:TRINITY_DN345_c0_g2_i1.p1 TRINITY_DN345_c0_g2~~TRINITY_DN345_c0_g2_i1.p1  ORF type:complete len:334 (-),score=88.80 TRINITY_DN345_c0_g2_i1:7-1008(-)